MRSKFSFNTNMAQGTKLGDDAQMTSNPGGGKGVYPKSDARKGGCVDLVLTGGWVKNPNILADVI